MAINIRFPVRPAKSYSIGLHVLAGAWWPIIDADGNEVCRVQALAGEINTDLLVRADAVAFAINKGAA